MDDKRVPLYERLPEIYRIRDEEQEPPYQLRNYLALVEEIFGDIHENIEALYSDLFIETCDDWVIPYIGDLLGASHLSGEPWTLRADVADTISLRRRKGTLASIERLTYNLTQWGVHCVELRENLLWHQRLNHQRPDAGGDAPYSLSSITRFTPIRGGIVTLRDPAMLSLLYTPFDPFAHVADLKPPAFGHIRYNLPNLAIFLWRLEDYRIQISKPVWKGADVVGATHIVRFEVHPQGEPLRLFNTYQFDPGRDPPVVTQIDETPSPIPTPRLTEDSESGNPAEYVCVDTYDPGDAGVTSVDISDVGLQLHLPEPVFPGQVWSGEHGSRWNIRGANLCAWEDGVQPPMQDGDIVIDPVIGRIVIGIASGDEATALKEDLLLTYTYGAVGRVGAHPISRRYKTKADKEVNRHVDADPHSLRKALDNVHLATAPVIIEIDDSMIHELDINDIQGRIPEDGGLNVRLAGPLVIRAADGQRPIVKLKRPLRFRPLHADKASGATLRLQGLYITRDESFQPSEPLIARAALDSLEIVDCTLDPGGSRELDGTAQGTRRRIRASLHLRKPYGFHEPADEKAFAQAQTPRVILQHSIAGPLLIDGGYRLSLTNSIVDAGKGVGDDPEDSFAISSATDPTDGWGPPAEVRGLTVFGRMRVESINGRGGVWLHALQVLDNQRGCIRYSCFSGVDDRLPQHLGCVKASEADLRFVSEVFGEPAYGQLAHASDLRIRERGPNDDAMGAFGFLLEAHRWRNIQVRFREFMPVGIRPVLIPVT